MHHALQIPEVLLLIFRYTSDHLALARTCRTFKEPALDLLWAELDDPSPISRCIQDASCHQETYHARNENPTMLWSFTRSLTEIEWDILRSYTRRILSVEDFSRGLAWESVKTFLNPPTTEPLLPNLRHLCCSHTGGSSDLCMPFPSLISFRVTFGFIDGSIMPLAPDFLDSLVNFSTQLKDFSLYLRQPDPTFERFFFGYICRWRNLHTVYCSKVTLNADTLTHLSCMPALTNLSFTLSTTSLDEIVSSSPPITFPSLRRLILYSRSLGPVSLFFSKMRLPATVHLKVFIESTPNRQQISSFFASFQPSGMAHTIQLVHLTQSTLTFHDFHTPVTPPRPSFGLQELEPCMRLSNLRCMDLQIDLDVEATQSELQTLASTWSRLESLVINHHVWYNAFK